MADEQTAIVTILTDMDAELEARLTKPPPQLKQGMMRELLSGRIRLVLVWFATAARSSYYFTPVK